MKRTLTVLSLIGINLVAVDSLRSLPFSAEYGVALISFYIIAALTFLLPSGFVAAELATGWPKRGGIYVWAREAFGEKVGFLVIYLQWIYNVVWYPTILTFVGGAFAYLYDPALAENKLYMFITILAINWLATIVNFFGMHLSGMISTFSALIGTLFPMVLISILGIVWLAQGNETAISFTVSGLLPQNGFKDISFYIALLFGLMGLEMSAVHAEETKEPEKIFPKAIFSSAFIIIVSLILSSLAVAMVVPKEKLNVVSGLFQAFHIFLAHFNLAWLQPILEMCVIIGAIGNVSAWLLGPSKGLMLAFRETGMSKLLGKENDYGVPKALMIGQGIVVSIIATLFLLLPTVSSSYWVLSVITSQLALLVYVGLFASFIRLRYSQPNVVRRFRIPGGNVGAILVGGIGLLACITGLAVGFVPPASIPYTSVFLYEGLLVGGLVVFLGIPAIALYRFQKPPPVE